jgi:hypothetical protein
MFVPFFSRQSGEVMGTSAALVMVMPIGGRETTQELLISRGVSTILVRRRSKSTAVKIAEVSAKANGRVYIARWMTTPSQKIQELMP